MSADAATGARVLRVAAITLAGSFRRTLEGNRKLACRLVAEAASQGARLICLPEAFTAKGVAAESVRDVAEEVPGPTTEALGEIARRTSSAVVCPIYTRRRGAFWNSAVLLGEDGEVAGIYDKRHPCASNEQLTELEGGVLPGRGPSVFALAGARVGVRICSDAWFPSRWAVAGEPSPEVLVWPSAHDGGGVPNAYALLHHHHLLCAVRTGRARVIGPGGRDVAASAAGEPLAIAELALDFLVVRADPEAGLPRRVEERFGDLVEIEERPEEGLVLLLPKARGPTRAELERSLGVRAAGAVAADHLVAYSEVDPAAVDPAEVDPAEVGRAEVGAR